MRIRLPGETLAGHLRNALMMLVLPVPVSPVTKILSQACSRRDRINGAYRPLLADKILQRRHLRGAGEREERCRSANSIARPERYIFVIGYFHPYTTSNIRGRCFVVNYRGCLTGAID
jgi:hypothetical protein